jgi:hypothetical protein
LSRRLQLGSPKDMAKISYSGYRFPPEIIHQAISYDLCKGADVRALRSRNRKAVTLATGNDRSRRGSGRRRFRDG